MRDENKRKPFILPPSSLLLKKRELIA